MPIFKGPDVLPLEPDLDEEQAARTKVAAVAAATAATPRLLATHLLGV